jgi:thioesterase domain-containing protein/NRPS condensation-like uncharacterized protein/acyl carrier protein
MLTQARHIDGSIEQPASAPDEPQSWPVSSAQLRIWFVEQLAEQTAAHNLAFGLRLIGDLDTAALDLSLKAVVDRHEALRTTFDIRDDEPVQLVHRMRPSVEIVDLRRHSTSEEEAYTVARREIYTPFDLRKGPLVRLVVLRLRADIHIMLGIFHHIICDNWSLRLFARELESCYQAFCDRVNPRLEPVHLQYGDYVSWQREWLGSEDFARKLSYWTETLADAGPLLDLSTDGRRPLEPAFTGSSQARRLSHDLVNSLKGLSAAHSATPFGVLLAVFQVLLYQYSGETDLLVGTPVAGRSSVELEEVIGNLVNLVVVRADLSGNPRFSHLLRKVREAILDALANQDVPFERLVEALHPSRNLAHNPIFQVLFASVKPAAPSQSFGGLQARPYIVEAMQTPFDLTISTIEDSPDSWWLRSEYRTDLLTYQQIAGLLDHYIELLKIVVTRPEVRLSQLPQPSNWPVPRGAKKGWCASHVDTTPDSAGAEPEHPTKRDLPQLRPLAEGEPSDRIEEILEGVWAKVLGTRPPGTTSNFFDLGGHSLMAVRLISEIGRAFGRKVPVSFVFQEPTIEAMARRLRREVRPAPSVVPLNETGSRSPFFCGGARWEQQDFSRALGRKQPFLQLDVFSLQEQRELAGKPLYRSVPHLATSLLQEILSIQPVGPYFLGGICEGGIIGLEIALQLQQQGHQVALLAEFDTPVTGYWRRHPIHWLRYGHWLISSGRLPSQMRYRFVMSMKRWFPSSPEEERLLRIWRVIWKAIRKYRPKREFDGEIQLFRAPNPWFVEDVATGWAARATRGIRVHEVPGGHVAFFCDPPSQRVMANIIEQAYRNSADR